MAMLPYLSPIRMLHYPSPILKRNSSKSGTDIGGNLQWNQIVFCRKKLLILDIFVYIRLLYCNESEQKARVTYDNILRLSDDPDVNDVIKFLREREIVHFQRFGEAMELLRQKLNQKNVYYMNPSFDM